MPSIRRSEFLKEIPRFRVLRKGGREASGKSTIPDGRGMASQIQSHSWRALAVLVFGDFQSLP